MINHKDEEMFQQIIEVLSVYLVGHVILGLMVAAVAYPYTEEDQEEFKEQLYQSLVEEGRQDEYSDAMGNTSLLVFAITVIFIWPVLVYDYISGRDIN